MGNSPTCLLVTPSVRECRVKGSIHTTARTAGVDDGGGQQCKAGPAVPATITASLAARAAAFAAGAIAIGIVVLPTEALLSAGAAPSQIVVARLFWGAMTLLLICLVVCPRRLVRSPAAHLRLCLVGLLLGWATTEFYTRALEAAAVLPVIVLLVAASAVTGMLLQLGTRLRAGHAFVLLSIVLAVAATVHAAKPAFDLSIEAVAFSLAAGVLYGSLPRLCRNIGRTPDLAAVAFYLAYGMLWAVGFSVLIDREPLRETEAILLDPDSVVAGALCTGLGYGLFQVGLSPDGQGRRLGESWAAMLYGFEPIAAIAVAGLCLDQAMSGPGLMFAAAFVVLVGLAGPTLARLTGPST